MKAYQFISLAILIGVVAIFIPTNSSSSLSSGDLIFTSLWGANADGFSIKTTTEIPSFTVIYFTDSEWNGNRFGSDENNITWNSGNQIIPANTILTFQHIDTSPILSHGTLTGKLKISKKEDAIFAYTGTQRMPSKFISATANNPEAYGTLLNTGLAIGSTAITFNKESTAKDDANALKGILARK